MRSPVPALLAMTLWLATTSPALAAWPNSPFTNLPLCTNTSEQYLPKAVTDGMGGAIVTWYDYRNGATDIYAQRVLASGAVDAAWPVNGLAVCTSAGDQYTPTIVSDGSGGAIVTWYDSRSGGYDIYAQHVLASGVVDAAWPANGRALCTATGFQDYPVIVSDGQGGAVVAWRDTRSASTFDVYAQHVLASGAVDPAWPANGRALCTATGDQDLIAATTDGSGGALVVWYDTRGASSDIYAQHVLASGAVDPAWPANGKAVCAATGNQAYPTIVADGSGGALVTWADARSGTSDIYAQHVLASGAADPAWPADGRALCTATGLQQYPTIVTDGAGGAIVTWDDTRSGNTDIYAQHVLASGAVDAAWPADGRVLCAATGHQRYPTIATDGSGGAIVAWYDFRGASYDIYAQHVLASGAVEGAWPADGRAVSTAGNTQALPTIIADGTGGVMVTWYDDRSGNYDIYCQRVGRYGYLGTPEAEIVSAKDVPNDQGGRVKLSWSASYLESDPYTLVTSYRVYRSVPPNLVASLRAKGASVKPVGEDEGSFVRPGELFTSASLGVTYYWEYLATVGADFLQNYSYLASTAQDSTPAGAPLTAFMVQARTAGSQHWESQPMTGYSVDNLPPAAPAPFSGEYAAGGTNLHWNRNTETDLAGYRLYRGTSASFVPGPGSLVAALPDTGYSDVPGAPSFYKLTAVDSHGNESPVATLLPAGTLGVEGGAASAELSFATPSPNPAGVRTTLRFTLPRAGSVRLAVHDAAGRLVRELSSGVREAGEYSQPWDLCDASGRAVGAGLYFARLETAGGTLVRRVAVTR